jgi:hypothetical protein
MRNPKVIPGFADEIVSSNTIIFRGDLSEAVRIGNLSIFKGYFCGFWIYELRRLLTVFEPLVDRFVLAHVLHNFSQIFLVPPKSRCAPEFQAPCSRPSCCSPTSYSRVEQTDRPTWLSSLRLVGTQKPRSGGRAAFQPPGRPSDWEGVIGGVNTHPVGSGLYTVASN